MSLLTHQEPTGQVGFTNILPGLEQILKKENFRVSIRILGFSGKPDIWQYLD